MKDYKHTLNLPNTAFPMKANLSQREPEILKRWEEMDLYYQSQVFCRGRPRFILHDGPPYANARPHLGTALNKILKDIVVKSKILSGFHAPYVPGWDCHGLPIELNVEKKIGKAGEKMSLADFRQACREYAQQQVELQKTDFKRLGVMGDWQQPYLTMHYSYEADVVRTLIKIIANGHLHRGQKPVHWCTACGSALAEAEVEYQDKSSPAIDVGFEVVEPRKLAEIFNISSEVLTPSIMVPIWTTTPWTLPANQAVTLRSDFDYVVFTGQFGNELISLICAKELLESVISRYGITHFTVHATVNGEWLEGLLLQHPFLPRQVPIILGEHVTLEMGTGCVHTAPAHGQDDYVVGEQYQLPMYSPVNAKGCFDNTVALVKGLYVFKADEPIIAELKNRGRLLHYVTIEHSYPHCWRHKTPLIFRATPQWFISMDQSGLRNQALAAVEQVTWMPSWGKIRMSRMLEARPDWCISRQRAWGIPIPLFMHKITGDLHPHTLEFLEQVAKRIEKEGVEAWHRLDPAELLGDATEDYEKVIDILDVWFDSGVSHACVLEKRAELGIPADLYFEGTDQYRGWFQTSLLTALAMHGQVPFKTILTHGYVVDAKGRKMSKSLGNVISPIDVVNTMGADVLRWWAAALDYKTDISASDEILNRSADAYRRIRNTSRFLLANLFDFNPEQDLVSIRAAISIRSMDY